ncbi:MAG: bifunctional aldolase/short-chain dehydrogenase [Thiomargarita sp.]|nr:bifunctional aldolase/short-chain dehydrogenase [Thiomargarita sp.]
MKNLWDDNQAAKYQTDLEIRVYSSRLLGQESKLVLHGGGNTSVKTELTNIFNEKEHILYVKGSGWDLATIEAEGFAPVKLDILKKMAQLPNLTDSEMVQEQGSAMINPNAPNPSVEAILHAIIPFKYVDHTHADAVVTITNTEIGAQRIQTIYGKRVLIVPYVMPGFILAQKICSMTQNIDWENLEAIILLNHGIFTFANSAKASYNRMIQLITEAENYLELQNATPKISPTHETTGLHKKLIELAKIRKSVSNIKGAAVIAKWDTSVEAMDFSNRADVFAIATQGPLTPDHVIRTKPIPAILDDNPEEDIINYAEAYNEYFKRNTNEHLIQLNPAPCWAIWHEFGLVSFGRSLKEANIISDIKNHTIEAIEIAEELGGWKALPESDIFELEYWELEQVKLAKHKSSLPLQGKIALVTGAANGIGRACVEALQAQGAVVAAIDMNPAITTLFNQQEIIGIECNITNQECIQSAIEQTVQHFGGLDILISNAGNFPISETIAKMKIKTWNDSLAINLTSHQCLLHACIPYLTAGIEPAVVMIASKNVTAPGPGAGAYSVAKAGQTQLARVAALELGYLGIRVNVIHPNAVFDTGIWTNEVLEKRATHYNMSVEKYKTNNILKTEVTSKNVAILACAMASPIFAKTTGAQVPVDGGNERVI